MLKKNEDKRKIKSLVFCLTLHEWSKSFYIDYEMLEGVNKFYQVAIMIK